MQEPLSNSSIKKVITDSGLVESLCDNPLDSSRAKARTSTLIEFPGTTRPKPEWRRQLSQRVREVQERKAREAAEELAAAQEAGMVSCALPSAQLELVPSLEQRVMNPIVSKALERLERARRPDQEMTGFANTAPAFEPVAEVIAQPEIAIDDAVETKPKLTVVAPAKSKSEVRDRKPVRVISDSIDDVALSYLETCLALPAIAVETTTTSAGFGRRLIAGTLDLMLVAVMAAPAAAAIEFSDGDWSNPRVIGLMSGIAATVMFAYLTISIALTGKTLAMRILSLRTIDLRTGLIPTGGQSMKRAVGYIFGLALLGLGLIYALVDPDRRTIYDRFSKTIVIHD
ncbi:MAG: hypothetical protein QOK48_3736 [Blastocatellia bacterium]|jgi:uncharacterized RDD family membrane protein YckC|nr:hypothetical protein [Blastocatellia bacterium]